MGRSPKSALCHPQRPHEARGLCHACYSGAYRRYRALGVTPQDVIREARMRYATRERGTPDAPYPSRLGQRLIRPHPDVFDAKQTGSVKSDT